jgi:hypothetical protein
MKILIRSPRQCLLCLPSPAKGPGTRREPGPFSTCGIESSNLFGHASIVSCLQARSRLFVTKGNFLIVESVENGKKCRCYGGLNGAANPYGFGTQPYYRTKALRPSSSCYALGCCRLIPLFKISVVILNN